MKPKLKLINQVDLGLRFILTVFMSVYGCYGCILQHIIILNIADFDTGVH